MSKHSRLRGCFAVALSAHAIPCHAAFFQLAENSAAGLGNAFAGGAASAEDASTVWYNPAGLTRLPGSQIVFGVHAIAPSIEASSVTASSAAVPPLLPSFPYSGGNGGDAGESAVVPNFYLSHQLTDRLTLGLGVNAPFGLSTDYEDNWAGRYHADQSEIVTMNINPAIGYRVNDQFSIGVGINYQKMDAELSQAVDYAMICTVAAGGALSGVCGAGAGVLPGTNDGHAKVTADDTAWGFNAGLLWQLQTNTRLGLAYHSKIQYSLTGDFDVTAPATIPAPALAALEAGGLRDSGAKAYVDLPATLSLSAHHQINPGWAVMGDVTRTYWSSLPELRIGFDSGQADSVVSLELKNVNRYSVGVTYTPGSAWTYRAGVALDQTPTPNETVRTPRLPDEDRWWLALGVGYRHSESFSFDVAYAYLKIDDASINKSAGAPGNENFLRGNLAASYESKTQILSAQARWAFR